MIQHSNEPIASGVLDASSRILLLRFGKWLTINNMLNNAARIKTTPVSFIAMTRNVGLFIMLVNGFFIME